MPVVIVRQEEVPALLPMPACIAAMEKVLRGLAEGDCLLPLRQIVWLPDRTGALGLMPAHWGDAKVVGLKAVTYFAGNEGTELDSHQGAVLLFDADRGRLLAMIDATSITAIRTAAVSGAATRVLARRDAASLTIIGSGVQARRHLEAMLVGRPIDQVRVCSKTLGRATRFAETASARHSVSVRPVATVREAVEDADIICTTTTSPDPVLFGDWIPTGAHINAVGSSVATARELDGPAVRRCRLYVDRVESARNEAGDFLLARQEGFVNDDHIVGEIGEVLAGRLHGRETEDEITLFKSVGLAVEDLAAAWHVYEEATRTGAGTTVDFGGRRCAAS